jgi:hypothetical protein
VHAQTCLDTTARRVLLVNMIELYSCIFAYFLHSLITVAARHRFAAAWLLGSRVQIALGAWMFVCCVYMLYCAV